MTDFSKILDKAKELETNSGKTVPMVRMEKEI